MSGPVLPEELLVEILSRLPVKDLMRFRCVSKSWNSLIFDPTLVKLHLLRSSKNTHILLTFDADDDWFGCRHCIAPCSIHGLLENPTLDDCHPLNLDDTVSVLGVCNGLVCLCKSYYGGGFNRFWFRFWNPATRTVSQDSPRIRLRPSDYTSPYFCMFGFGYDCWSDTYQVVLLDNKSQSQKMEVRVHCLGGTGWRNILTCPSFPSLSRHGASVSGTVNWLALPNLKSSYQRENVTINELVIFSYDLKNETYSYLSMPRGLSEVPPEVPKLEVLKGCLFLSHHGRRNNFVVWLMREFGVENSWTQLLNISYDKLHIRDYIIPALPTVLCMSENDDIMLLANYEYAEFILYNTRDNRIERHEHFNGGGDFNGGDFNYGRFLSYDYVQSLVSPYRN